MEKNRDLRDGEVTYVKGSAVVPYALKNIGGVYSCSCPAWRNQSKPIERRTCKHLKALRGLEVEHDRIGEVAPDAPKASKSSSKKSAPPVLLAQRWDGELDLTGWWISEKLDGVRAYWDGEAFLSRTGNTYHAPEWFTAGLGKDPLDGELWIGRAAFQETVSVVRRFDRGEQWRRVKYVVFDLPSSTQPFEERVESLKRRFEKDAHEFVDVLEHQPCNGTDHINERLRAIESVGGEGLMLREPGSQYVAGRSSTLMKVKSFLDAEARVTDHLDGKGRHKGRVGALRVELPDGTPFSIGTGLSDAEREAPPPLGSVVTFRYFELTPDGVPRFPTFIGIRDDFEWPGAPAKASGAVTSGARYFELNDGKSAKFWEIRTTDDGYTVRYGRIGTDGQTKTKAIANPTAAAAKLIESKTRKGYVEQT